MGQICGLLKIRLVLTSIIYSEAGDNQYFAKQKLEQNTYIFYR